MCGIAGKASGRGSIDRTDVERMCAAQEHRGPDSRGIHLTEGACLGIQRLRVIDLETGDQPIFNEDGSVAVVLNGEIYNYRELRRDLERRGHDFRTKGDTEVIAHLYEEHGPGFVTELSGMFALALWDSNRRRLVLARDRVGKKPLFLCEREDTIAFASELRALTTDPWVPREADPAAVACYLAYGYIPAPRSIWRHVRKLPPAHTLVWENGASRLERYWALDYSKKIDDSADEIAARLRDEVGQAVRRRMVSDVPLGAFLSGGIDSSIVVAEMAAASEAPIRTFSIGFENNRYNELPRARQVADRFGTDHSEFIVRPDAAEMLPTLAAQYGEPFADSSAIPTFHLADQARRHVTVALNGDGGDESFAGYPRHLANSRTAWLDAVPAALRRTAARVGAAIPSPRDRKSRIDYVRRMLVSLDGNAAQRYQEHVSIFDPTTLAELMRELGPTTSGSAGLIEQAWNAASATDPLDRLLEVDIHTYLPGDLLPKVDVATMAHSLEARSPLLDHQLMEFAASIPARHKTTLRGGKAILRTAYRGVIPDEVLDGPKMGFAVPLGDWFRGPLGALAEELLADPGPITSHLDRGVISSTFAHHRAGRGDHSARLWALVVLAAWESQLT